MNNPSLVYLFNKYSLSHYCGPDIVLGSGDAKMNNPCCMPSRTWQSSYRCYNVLYVSWRPRWGSPDANYLPPTRKPLNASWFTSDIPYEFLEFLFNKHTAPCARHYSKNFTIGNSFNLLSTLRGRFYGYSHFKMKK